MNSEQQYATISPDTLARWSSPDGAQLVELSQELVEDLRLAAIEAFLAIPRRGMEIGGLLYGDVIEAGPGRVRFQLSAFETIPCEHASGPSYTFSEADRARLARTLAQRRTDGSRPTVGFFRSYTGRDAQPDTADQDLIRTFFPDRNFLCLLLQPLSVEKCLASFRFQRGFELLPEAPGQPFPFAMETFETEAMDAGPFPVFAPPPEPVVIPEPEPEPTEPIAAQPSLTEPVYTEPVFPEPVSSEPAAPEPATPEPAAPEPHPAFAREVPWHLRYQEQARQVSRFTDIRKFVFPVLFFALFVIAAGAIRELSKRNSEPRWVPLHFDARVHEGDVVLNWDPGIPAVTQAARGVLLVNDGRTPKTIELTPEILHRGNLKFTPESADVLFRLRLYGDGAPVVTDSLRVITVPRQVAAPTPAPKAPVESVAVSPASRRNPAVRREVQPEVPAGIRNRITAPATIQVIVEIDPAGRVTRAFSKVPGHGLDRYLADEAVRAARQWLFTPSRSKTTRVLTFEFTPPAR